MRFTLLLLAILGAVGGSTGAAWLLEPGFREVVLIGGLVSGVDVLQAQSAYALREYPTERAALALIAFVNVQYAPRVDRDPWRELLERPRDVPEPEKREQLRQLVAWGCLATRDAFEAAQREREALRACVYARLDAEDAERERSRELARRALYSVCVLTGEPFGTDFDPARHAYGSLREREWVASLEALDVGTEQTFGPVTVRQGLDALAEERG